jgi:uracil-DNA glycosylase family 4
MPTNRPRATARRADRTPRKTGPRQVSPIAGRAIPSPPKTLATISRRIVTCEACPRLRQYCQRIGREKRAAYRTDTYWARPVPGFGDPKARIVLVGLAPAAHGANRTGRVFTGDGRGGSGDFLMTALHANGLANQPFSTSADDGLKLHDTWILSAVRCAPPDNTPSPDEIARCHPHLRAELAALPRMTVIVALGRLAFDACWRILLEHGAPTSPKPEFGHGAVHTFAGLPTLVASYHPSRQNTQTGRLTQEMLREVMRTARELADARSALWSCRRVRRSAP